MEINLLNQKCVFSLLHSLQLTPDFVQKIAVRLADYNFVLNCANVTITFYVRALVNLTWGNVDR